MKKILLSSFMLLLLAIILPGMFAEGSIDSSKKDRDLAAQNSKDQQDKIVPLFSECFPFSDCDPVRKTVERNCGSESNTVQPVPRMFSPVSVSLFRRFQLNRFSEALNPHSAILAYSNRSIYLVFLVLLN